METNIITGLDLEMATGILSGLLKEKSIEQASIEYFFTLQEGIPTHTFKVSYETKK